MYVGLLMHAEKYYMNCLYAFTISIFFTRLYYKMLKERKPQFLKQKTPMKSALTAKGHASSPMVTTNPSAITNGLGTDVIMEGDEGDLDVSPVKRLRVDNEGELKHYTCDK